MEVLIVEIYAKAKELAEALAASSELAAVKEAEVKMMMPPLSGYNGTYV